MELGCRSPHFAGEDYFPHPQPLQNVSPLAMEDPVQPFASLPHPAPPEIYQPLASYAPTNTSPLPHVLFSLSTKRVDFAQETTPNSS
jgi:hypothetical protein